MMTFWKFEVEDQFVFVESSNLFFYLTSAKNFCQANMWGKVGNVKGILFEEDHQPNQPIQANRVQRKEWDINLEKM